MRYAACMRCGSLDLAMPGIRDGIFPEGGELMASLCTRCGHQAMPVVFEDKAAWEAFRQDREALFKPGAPPELPEELAYPPRPRKWWSRGMASLVGFVFVSSAIFLFLTAARVGGQAWFTLAPSGIVALLLGLPFIMMARRR